MLVVKGIDHRVSAIRWTVASPVPGVAVLDLSLGEAKTPVPLHWRGGVWDKPPLDTMLDSDGQLLGLQYVMQYEQVHPRDEPKCDDEAPGVPVFDTGSFPFGRYMDEQIEVKPYRTVLDSLLLCIGSECPPAAHIVQAPGCFSRSAARISCHALRSAP